VKTGKKAWIGQRQRDIDAKGKSKAPWRVYWNDPHTGKRREKSCGPGRDGRLLAMKESEKLHGQIVTGSYDSPTEATWAEFREKYNQRVLNVADASTAEAIRYSLAHFERIVKPGKMARITNDTLEEFVAARRTERGRRQGETVSTATINKDLRHLRAALNKAHRWGHLPKVPDFEFLREPRREVVYMTPEHFSAIYDACDTARMPRGLHCPPGDWWRALLMTSYMTGWRIGETLNLRRDDVDFEAGIAKLYASETKGRADAKVPLHSVVLDHLKSVMSFADRFFPWPHSRRALWTAFYRIQKAAGIALPCPQAGNHKCTAACHLYGFHSQRYAFATMNAGKLSGDALQALMRHKSYSTTQRYINAARQLDEAVQTLYVPEVGKAASGGI